MKKTDLESVCPDCGNTSGLPGDKCPNCGGTIISLEAESGKHHENTDENEPEVYSTEVLAQEEAAEGLEDIDTIK